MRRWLLFAIVLLTTSSLRAQDYAPYFIPTPCPFPPIERVDCGQLIVPEDRENPEAASIQLSVAILRAAGGGLPDPVIYLSGGPGGAAVLNLERWIESPIRQSRDMILIDQRGTGFSRPSLNCPEIELNDPGLFVSPVSACRQRLLEEGVNLSAYTSAASAADINDLRVALGYEQVNLYGVSYGTRLALTVIRDYPGTVRSAVLDSVFPPEVDALEDRAENRFNAFKALFDACAANPACQARYPDLENTFYDVVARYNAAPVELSLWQLGFQFQRQITGNDIADALFNGMYNTEALPLMPLGIELLATANNSDDQIMGFNILRGFYTPDILAGNFPDFSSDIIESEQVRQYIRDYGQIDLAEGMNLSVDCSEEFPFSDPDETARLGIEIVPEELTDYLFMTVQSSQFRCSSWGVDSAEDIEDQPVQSDVPTLLLSGLFDPVTPLPWAMSASDNLSNSQMVLFPYGGHGVSVTDDCAANLVAAFFEAPTNPLDSTCALAESSIPFYLGEAP